MARPLRSVRGPWLAAAIASLAVAGCARGRPCAPCRVVSPAPAIAALVPARAPSPRAAERARRVEAAKEGTAHLPLVGNDEARAAVPALARFEEVPLLARVGAVLPKTMEAEMRAWAALQKEAGLAPGLQAEVFMTVSAANGCEY